MSRRLQVRSTLYEKPYGGPLGLRTAKVSPMVCLQ